MKFGLLVATLFLALQPSETTLISGYNSPFLQTTPPNLQGAYTPTLSSSFAPSFSTGQLSNDFNALRSSLTSLSDRQRSMFQSLDPTKTNSAVVIGSGNSAAGTGNMISGDQNSAYGVDLSILGSGNAIKGSNSTILGN